MSGRKQTRSKLTFVQTAFQQRGWLLALCLLTAAACADVKQPTAPRLPTQLIESNNGIVASADPLATAAGVRMLELGGNAVDAAVATGFALTVVEPSMSGIGGRAVILLRLPDGSFHGVDGMSEVPSSYKLAEGEDTEYGYRTIGIPGAVAAYADVLSKFGTLPLSVVMQPAIELAEEGFQLPFSTVNSKLSEFEGSRSTYWHSNGTPYLAGEHYRAADLAKTLRLIAEKGPDAFYRGEIAKAIAKDMENNGGYVTLADLANYKARPLDIVHGSYRGFELVATGSPPSGYMLIEALHILEHFDLQKLDEVMWATRLCEALTVARADRDTLPGPAADREALMVSKKWAAERVSALRTAASPEPAADGSYTDDEPVHTSHLSVVDRNGMVVSLTQSLGPEFGSGVVTPGLGFPYAVTMGSYKGGAPGTRPNLSQSPFIVQQNGEPLLVLGAAGGGRIPSAILAVVSRLLDRGDTFAEAVHNRRVHTGSSCPRLENSGVYSFEGSIDQQALTGQFRSEWGDIFPVSGVRVGRGDGPAGSWELTASGATTHPYSDVGVLSVLRIAESDSGYAAELANGTGNLLGQPQLAPRAASEVSIAGNQIKLIFTPTISWPESDYETARRSGAKPQADRPVARVHALYRDKARDLWLGAADPRGRGSAGSAVASSDQQ